MASTTTPAGREAAPSERSLVRRALAFGALGTVALALVAAAVGGAPAALACVAMGALGAAGLAALARGLSALVIPGRDPAFAGRVAVAAFVVRHLVLALAAFGLVIVLELPGVWLAAAATTWPAAAAVAALTLGAGRLPRHAEG